MEKTIKHKAKIVSSDGTKVILEILSLSACSACHAKSACSSSDSKEKLIEIISPNKYTPGEEVYIEGQENLSFKAMLYAYVFPIIIMLFTLVILDTNGVNEGISGILSLVSLVPYFIYLKFNNNKLSKIFKFNIIEK